MNAKLRIRLFFANVLFLILVLFIARGSPERAFAAFATGVVFSLVLARYISSHVEGLTNDVSIALRKVTAGDFSQRLPISGDEDIAALGASFNAMTQAFGSSILKLQEARREAESVVAAMSEGVIVLDRYGRITFANASFRSLLDGDHPDPSGKSLLEVFRLPELENSVRTRLVGEPRIVEFSFNGGRLLQATSLLYRMRKAVKVLRLFFFTTSRQFVVRKACAETSLRMYRMNSKRRWLQYWVMPRRF